MKQQNQLKNVNILNKTELHLNSKKNCNFIQKQTIENCSFKDLKHTKITVSYGTFYFFEQFVVSEINEGVHFDWEKAKKILDLMQTHYGSNCKVGYIANRVNNYSIELQSFLKMKKFKYNYIIAEAIVIYSDVGLRVATLEKLFAKYSIKRCYSLEEAIYWILNLNEIKKTNQIK